MKIFKKTWLKALRRGEPIEKLADDLDPKYMKGVVNIRQYDPLTGQTIRSWDEHNTLVNQSKSNLIRLISQGSSRWQNPIDPTTLKISKMRFCNNDPGGGAIPNTLMYYDIAEPSSRACIPPTGDIHAGGGPNATITADPLASILYSVANVSGNYVVGTLPELKIYTLKNASSSGTALIDHPPSHSTLKVELLLGATVVETIYFYNPLDLTTIYRYPRASYNPYKIVTTGIISANIIDYYAGAPSIVGGNLEKVIVSGDNCYTYLFYDYNTSQWKFQIHERTGANTKYDTVRFSFERGRYNIINSVVPRDGYNTGRGQTLTLRYSGNTAGDSYPILSTLEYRDSQTDFIDDYSVTFSVNMSSQYGNGVITLGTEYIKYKECYLMNTVNDVFSALYLTSTFDKNSLSAYFISWTILSPVS
jgi:hypothetical protein